MTTFKEFLAEEMKDSEFAAEYEKGLAEERARCKRLIDLERAVLSAAVEWREAELAGDRAESAYNAAAYGGDGTPAEAEAAHTELLRHNSEWCKRLAALGKAVDTLVRARGEKGSGGDARTETEVNHAT